MRQGNKQQASNGETSQCQRARRDSSTPLTLTKMSAHVTMVIQDIFSLHFDFGFYLS